MFVVNVVIQILNFPERWIHAHMNYWTSYKGLGVKTMKVKDLIEKLKFEDPEAKVVLRHTEYPNPESSRGYPVINDWFDVGNTEYDGKDVVVLS